MLRTYDILDGKVTEDDMGRIEVYIAPSDEEKRRLVQDFKLDEHTLTSSLDPDELSRLEFEPEHTAMIYKRPRNYSGTDGVLFKVSSTGIFLFRDRLIIVQPEDLTLFDGKQFARVSTLNEVALKLIYRAIFHYLGHLRVMNSISEQLEHKINTAMENRYLINLFGLEKSLVYYVNSIHSNGILLEKLKHSSAKLDFSQEEQELLDDISVENSQCFRQAEIYSNILASLMDARASIVSNNINVLMKTLNIITISIMMPTLVVSIFSMNVALPLQTHRLAFWLVLVLSAIAAAGFILVWRRLRW